ncbi:hypothetical protein NPIL_422971 [Nephila pilipes]|uniref:Uncharacterized protein n=1 Tax=Nephila pilipes TaxID=299642 RepID=A0A8X6U1P0_NEPPI|nr:hypothetical protein NPIL_422971 [Nephila pilipes]
MAEGETVPNRSEKVKTHSGELGSERRRTSTGEELALSAGWCSRQASIPTRSKSRYKQQWQTKNRNAYGNHTCSFDAKGERYYLRAFLLLFCYFPTLATILPLDI